MPLSLTGTITSSALPLVAFRCDRSTASNNSRVPSGDHAGHTSLTASDPAPSQLAQLLAWPDQLDVVSVFIFVERYPPVRTRTLLPGFVRDCWPCTVPSSPSRLVMRRHRSSRSPQRLSLRPMMTRRRPRLRGPALELTEVRRWLTAGESLDGFAQGGDLRHGFPSSTSRVARVARPLASRALTVPVGRPRWRPPAPPTGRPGGAARSPRAGRPEACVAPEAARHCHRCHPRAAPRRAAELDLSDAAPFAISYGRGSPRPSGARPPVVGAEQARSDR